MAGRWGAGHGWVEPTRPPCRRSGRGSPHAARPPPWQADTIAPWAAWQALTVAPAPSGGEAPRERVVGGGRGADTRYGDEGQGGDASRVASRPGHVDTGLAVTRRYTPPVRPEEARTEMRIIARHVCAFGPDGRQGDPASSWRATTILRTPAGCNAALQPAGPTQVSFPDGRRSPGATVRPWGHRPIPGGAGPQRIAPWRCNAALQPQADAPSPRAASGRTRGAVTRRYTRPSVSARGSTRVDAVAHVHAGCLIARWRCNAALQPLERDRL